MHWVLQAWNSDSKIEYNLLEFRWCILRIVAKNIDFEVKWDCSQSGFCHFSSQAALSKLIKLYAFTF